MPTHVETVADCPCCDPCPDWPNFGQCGGDYCDIDGRRYHRVKLTLKNVTFCGVNLGDMSAVSSGGCNDQLALDDTIDILNTFDFVIPAGTLCDDEQTTEPLTIHATIARSDGVDCFFLQGHAKLGLSPTTNWFMDFADLAESPPRVEFGGSGLLYSDPAGFTLDISGAILECDA